MRKRNWLRLAAAILCAALLCGCAAAPAAVRKRSQTALRLYYRNADGRFDTGLGALAAEDGPALPQTPAQLLARYLDGPQAEGHVLPFEKSAVCTVDACRDGTLTLRLQTDASGGLDIAVAAACLTRTMTQLEEVSTVRLVVQNEAGEQSYGPYTASSFLLADDAGQSPAYTVRLYFADRTGLLVASEQSIAAGRQDQLPLLALQTLLAAQPPANTLRAVPEGTQVLDLSVTDKEAAVVLSADFLNCDTSERHARTAVRAVVATLCALDAVEAVQLTVVGAAGLTYCDISQALSPSADWFAE